MKQRAVLAVVLMTAAVAAGAQEAAPAADAPKPVIDIAEKIKDFGVVAKGDKLNATFVVKNTGAAPLEITQVRPTCGCTVANFDKTIAPGGTGKIDAEVDTAGFNGPISKAVLVFSNDPATPQVNLVVKADIRAFIEVLPRNLIRFNVLSGEPATEKVRTASSRCSRWMPGAAPTRRRSASCPMRSASRSARAHSGKSR